MFEKLNDATAKPVAWSAYTADTLWTDPHISKQMLSYHLNPSINAASRAFEVIERSVDWLVGEFGLGPSSSVVDFGCGPGLYTQRLKQRGVGTVVGLDFSANSLQYATAQATAERLDIEYRLGNYLDFEDVRTFDLITLVMCDFCALSPSQRSKLLKTFKSRLKPQGVIALDVFTEHRFQQQSESIGLYKNHMDNFWSSDDHWCIQSSFAYAAELLWLDKFVIIEPQREWTIYNWLQHYNTESLGRELSDHGLVIRELYSNLCGDPLTEGEEMAAIITHR